MPVGIELVGNYAAIFLSEEESGSCKTVLRMDSYGAMDKFAAEAGQNLELAQLLEEYALFGDLRLGANFSSELLKSVSDVTIWAVRPRNNPEPAIKVPNRDR